MASHVLGPVADVPPGSRKLFEIAGKAVVVFNLGGEFFALNNRCPHLGGSLFHGVQTALVESDEPGDYQCSRPGEIIKCPWHGWEFDIRTGQSYCDPARVRVRQYPVAVAKGGDLPQRRSAETVPVRVEDSYIVVDA